MAAAPLFKSDGAAAAAASAAIPPPPSDHVAIAALFDLSINQLQLYVSGSTELRATIRAIEIESVPDLKTTTTMRVPIDMLNLARGVLTTGTLFRIDNIETLKGDVFVRCLNSADARIPAMQSDFRLSAPDKLLYSYPCPHEKGVMLRYHANLPAYVCPPPPPFPSAHPPAPSSVKQL